MSKDKQFFSTGCTLLDLVVGGGQGMGIPAGKIVNFIGDKSSGKTLLATEMIAANHHRLKKAFLWNYDDGESGYTFNTEALYGFTMMNEETLHSKTVEDFDVNTTRFLKKAKKTTSGVYVIDSLDGLSDEEKEQRAKDRYTAAEKGKTFDDGTYGTKTPKFLSQEFFKTKAGDFDGTNTALVIISQTRQKLDGTVTKYTPATEKYTRSGGKALDFYAHTVLWLFNVTKITKEVGKGDAKEKRTVGVIVKAVTSKSKTPRPFRECTFSIYFDYGIDNIGSNLDYLYDLRTPGGKLQMSKANNIEWNKDMILTRDELIAKIESDSKMEKELEKRVIEKWEAIEAQAATNRKRKY